MNAHVLDTLPTRINVLKKNKEKECIYDDWWILDRSVQGEKIYFVFIDIICEWKEFMSLTIYKRLKAGNIIELKGGGAYSVALSNDFHLRYRLHSKICKEEGN